MAFYLASILTLYLAFYLTYILTFCSGFSLAFCLASSLACVRVQAPSTAFCARSQIHGLLKHTEQRREVGVGGRVGGRGEEGGGGGRRRRGHVAPLLKSRDRPHRAGGEKSNTSIPKLRFFSWVTHATHRFNSGLVLGAFNSSSIQRRNSV